MNESNSDRKVYAATVIGNTLAVSKDKKTPSIKLKVQTMYETSDVAKPVVHTFWGDLWLTYAAMEKTLKTLRETFGWQGSLISEFTEPILVGKKIEVVVDWEEWDGRPRANIAFYNRLGGMQGVEGEDLVKLVGQVQPALNEALGLPQMQGVDSEVAGQDAPPPNEGAAPLHDGMVF